MLSCKDTSKIISQSLDCQLTMRERFALKLHLLMCKYCKRFSQQLKAIHVALRSATSVTENDVTIKIPADTKKRITDMVEAGT